mmetsp:Transcript_2291/g.4236  ORF Transcript_2291/g.4236 Transcript_2291/m.4236 type:complete len:281 (-) Transcript_2291:346-1188(-)
MLTVSASMELHRSSWYFSSSLRAEQRATSRSKKEWNRMLRYSAEWALACTLSFTRVLRAPVTVDNSSHGLNRSPQFPFVISSAPPVRYLGEEVEEGVAEEGSDGEEAQCSASREVCSEVVAACSCLVAACTLFRLSSTAFTFFSQPTVSSFTSTSLSSGRYGSGSWLHMKVRMSSGAGASAALWLLSREAEPEPMNSSQMGSFLNQGNATSSSHSRLRPCMRSVRNSLSCVPVSFLGGSAGTRRPYVKNFALRLSLRVSKSLKRWRHAMSSPSDAFSRIR